MTHTHRLGLQGEWGLKKELVETADKMGITIRKHSLLENRYDISLHGESRAKIAEMLPTALREQENYSFKEVKNFLKFMTQPVAQIASEISSSKKGADATRRDLHAALRFASAGKITPQKLQLDSFDAYHEEHDDECEDVAQEMEEEAAWRYDSELSGNLLPGLKFGKNSGNILLLLDHTQQEGEAQRSLQNMLYSAIRTATGQNVVESKPDILALTTPQFETLCKNIASGLDVNPDLLQGALSEELKQDTLAAVEERIPTFQASSSLTRLETLKPDLAIETDARLAALTLGANALQDFINTDTVKKVWKKFNITKRKDPADINAISERLDALKTAISHYTQDGQTSCDLPTAEAIAAEFRDVTAFGRELSHYIANGISGDNPEQDKIRLQWELMEKTFTHASIADVTIARDYMDEPGQNIAHYIGRHAGTEGADYAKAFKDFVDDFGGEIVEFYQKHPILTSAAVLTFYYGMNSGGGGAEVLVIPPEFQAAAAIDPVSGLPLTIDAPQDLVFKQCHWHSPVKLPFFEHCLLSNQAAAQLGDAYALLKAPLTMMLDAPEGSIHSIEGLRGADAPAFAFADNFNSALKTAGDAYFVANGYQNLAHAPWFSIATIMGWKLGAVEAMKRSSFLVTPLVDAGYALATQKPLIVAGSVTAAVYGYSMQGLSGGVSGAVMGAIPGWGVHGVADLTRKIPEIGFLKDNNIGQSFTHEAVSRRKLDALAAWDDYTLTATLPVMTGPAMTDETELPADVTRALPQSHEMDVTLDLGGENTQFKLDKKSFSALQTAIAEFAYTLETQSEKIGLEDESSKHRSALSLKAGALSTTGLEATTLHETLYQACSGVADIRLEWNKVETLLEKTQTMLRALDEYKDEGELEGSGYKPWLQQVFRDNLEPIIAAEMMHLGRTKIFDALEQPMSRRQKGELTLKASQSLRWNARADAHGEDWARVKTTFNNALNSLQNAKSEPLLVPLSLGFRAGALGATGLKVTLRETWYQVCSRLSDIRFQWNKVEPKTKGHVIGAGLTVTAAAIGTDFSPELADAVKDNLGTGTHEALQTVSATAGKAAGAGTATGLFGMYNFGEDHMVVHVGLGFMFILASATVKNLAYKPFEAVVLKPSKVIGQGLNDLAQDKLGLTISTPSALKTSVEYVRSYLDKARNYDRDHMPPQPENI